MQTRLLMSSQGSWQSLSLVSKWKLGHHGAQNDRGAEGLSASASQVSCASSCAAVPWV